MKKFIAIIVLFILVIPISGCLKRDDLEDVSVYTTTYPIEFLTNALYGYNSEILSIYPDGIDLKTYQLTEKKIKDYSQASIFVYNGLSEEKQIAKGFVNNNKNIRIIDVSYGLKYEYGIEELWLSPNNYLMLATTIKNNLQEFISNKYIREEIETNYLTKLEDPLSQMDAELRRIGSISKEEKHNTIVVSSSALKFLENYGFNVIALDDDENLSTNNLNTIKNNFKNNTYQYLFVRDDEVQSSLISDLINDYNIEVLTFKIMANLTDDERKSNETYFTMMNANIENIKLATIGK